MAFPVENPMPNDAIIYRSIPKGGNPKQWVEEQNRPSSVAFRDTRRRLSTNWAKHKPDPNDSVRPNTKAIVSLFVSDCRGCKKEVEHSPIQEGEEHGPNQAHCDICDPPGQRLSDEEETIARDEMARTCILVLLVPVEPPG